MPSSTAFPLCFPSEAHRHSLCLVKEWGHFRRSPGSCCCDCHQVGLAGCSNPVVGLSGPQELLLHSSPNLEDGSSTRKCLLLDEGLLYSSLASGLSRAGREMEWQGDRVYRLPERPLWESGDLGSGSSSATPSPGHPGKLLLPACLSLPVCELGMCSPALLHKVSTRWSSGLLYLIDDYFFHRVSEGFSLTSCLFSQAEFTFLGRHFWEASPSPPPPPSLGSLLLPRLRWGVSPESSDPL